MEVYILLYSNNFSVMNHQYVWRLTPICCKLHSLLAGSPVTPAREQVSVL